MNFLKSLWRKLFGVKTGAYSSDQIDRALARKWVVMGNKEPENYDPVMRELLKIRPAYDPHQDEHKIMSGEIESYFD